MTTRSPGELDDRALVDAVRRGDESAFLELVDRHHQAMLRIARMFGDADTAQDVVQEAWIAVLQGIGSFEGRSSFRTWMTSIVANRARSRFARDRRVVPFSSLGADVEGDEPAVEPERFRPPTDRRWPGGWASFPAPWPEERLLQRETLDLVRRAIGDLPRSQQAVITLRDVEGRDAAETCELLGISEVNQRVLLHRARSRVRRALDPHMLEEG